MRILVSVLLCLTAPSTAKADTPADATRRAIEKGLRRIEQGAAAYTKNRDCFSCHHQALSIFSLTSARQRGFEVEPARIRRQIDFTLDTFKPRREQILKGQGVPGQNTTAVYALFALDAGGHGADETTAALVEYLLAKQRPDGSWPAQTKRPPTEGSAFTNTSLALLSLHAYGPTEDNEPARKLRERIAKAVDQGRQWLLQNEPETTEDKVFHLRGLVSAGAAKEALATARAGLLKEQREDGSWAQLIDLAGDAYATGTVLLALRVAGVEAADPAYQKGVRYLLGSQKEDGSWIVQTRSRPVQIFFDNGDPGGKSQFISFAATNWAVLALLELYPPKPR